MLGERPLSDFPDGTLARREVAAWHVSEATGWGIVPPTVLRDGPFGEGMVQSFVEADPDVDVVEMVVGDDPRLRRMAVLDAVMNNTDRKGGHILPVDGARRIHGVDHGVCFSAVPKLRTVLWGWRGEPFAAGRDRGAGADPCGARLATWRRGCASCCRGPRFGPRPGGPTSCWRPATSPTRRRPGRRCPGRRSRADRPGPRPDVADGNAYGIRLAAVSTLAPTEGRSGRSNAMERTRRERTSGTDPGDVEQAQPAGAPDGVGHAGGHHRMDHRTDRLLRDRRRRTVAHLAPSRCWSSST